MPDVFSFPSTDRPGRIREALLRTVAYFDAIDYAPTWAEVSAWVEWSGAQGFDQLAVPTAEELVVARDALVGERKLESAFGRVALQGRLAVLSALVLDRMRVVPRKFRRAKRVARWLACFRSVRFVALVNTTALSHARDRADLDFFVITSHGHIWTTRLFSAGSYRFLGRLANAEEIPDAICLSYFISDASLDLGSHMLVGDDPYFRYWFLSMMPLYDDGIAQQLWAANGQILAKHPRAMPWQISSDVCVTPPRVRIPRTPSTEAWARKIQHRWFPAQIRDRMNQDQAVIVSDEALKFHVDDAREVFKQRYEERLETLGL
ncbi:hypothetical protein GF380_00535 [Candidatus Uhrbacteria bacterium]|nr:hypothetical protein [Candidatus Uhrbacteria bacterium]MBD3283872.1 hypothetical protein [Candidatus Uhrbacteria bacterium]